MRSTRTRTASLRIVRKDGGSSCEQRRATLAPTSSGNWRGPIWINVQCVLAYALHSAGLHDEALALASNVTRLLADDLRKTGVWHENYDAETGLGLGACARREEWRVVVT